MARIIKPIIYGAIIGGLGLTAGSRSIVDYLDRGNRPAYEAAQSHLQQIHELESQKIPLYNEVGDKIMKVRSSLNTGGRVDPLDLESLANVVRNSEKGIDKIDERIFSIRDSPEYKSYESESARVNHDVYLFCRIILGEYGLLLMGAGIASVFSKKK